MEFQYAQDKECINKDQDKEFMVNETERSPKLQCNITTDDRS